MDAFEIRRQLVGDYAQYVQSFINIRDRRIAECVQSELDSGLLWPDPLIQLNPAFEAGDSIDALVAEGVLHEECSRIFKKDKEPGSNNSGKPLNLYRHQSEAVRCAVQNHNYVLTTGTASGKSLSYIVPIVNQILRRGSGAGIQALIVYPMNALANSQYRELEKFLHYGYPEGRPPVRFAQYTGQEKDERRKEIIADPPDILITNYVMAELILTRPDERQLVEAARGLRFLVMDELHTYRGRQGADVALLIRRLRNRVSSELLQYVGTSATMAGGGNFDQQRKEVSAIASKFFGATVRPEHVIGETLQPATPPLLPNSAESRETLRSRVLSTPGVTRSYKDFVADPLSSWIEHRLGLGIEEGTGRRVRALPRSLFGPEGASDLLAKETGLPPELCARSLQDQLLRSYSVGKNPENGFPPFAFRLHQFISKGDTVYATPEDEGSRYVTVHGQQYVPGDRNRILLPLVFCRECGQEYYCVRASNSSSPGSRRFEPREAQDQEGTDEVVPGYLYISISNPWPSSADEIVERVPEDWVEEHRGTRRVKSSQRKNVPQVVRVAPDGAESAEGVEASFVSSPFRFCLSCGVAYGGRQKSDFAKLSSLSSRRASTTLRQPAWEFSDFSPLTLTARAD